MPVSQAEFDSGNNESKVFIEVCVPEDYLGAIVGDLAGREARIITLGTKGKLKTVCAEISMEKLSD